MKTHILPSLRILLVMTLLTGVLYPVLMTVIAKVCFQFQADGSMIEKNGKIIGSELIAQKFQGERYFWPRPSAVNYIPYPSGASNLGPTSDSLKRLVQRRKEDFIGKNGLAPTALVPVEMLFSSGSGVDPHISPEAALLQLNRVAAGRHFDEIQKKALLVLVQNHVEGQQFGILGEQRVNVLRLNLALDEMK